MGNREENRPLTPFLRLGMIAACAGLAGDVFLPVMLPVSPLRVVSSAWSEATQIATGYLEERAIWPTCRIGLQF